MDIFRILSRTASGFRSMISPGFRDSSTVIPGIASGFPRELLLSFQDSFRYFSWTAFISLILPSFSYVIPSVLHSGIVSRILPES